MLKPISYKILNDTVTEEFVLQEAPERALQFGEGNFLRGFVDYFVDIMNEKQNFDCKVLVVQPIERGLSDLINQQQGLYQLYLNGINEGQASSEKRLISCISRAINPYEDFESFLEAAKNPQMRFIFTNTTEAGIVFDEGSNFSDRPANSFPAKLTRFLYERYTSFSHSQGFIILSCELIDDNGSKLKEYVLRHAAEWGLADDFIKWIGDSNYFCNTLVDRIVTGYPKNNAKSLDRQNGFTDALMNTAESFGLWVIEGPKALAEELPFAESGLPVFFTDDLKPFKTRKVRILNGIHTIMVPVCYLYGKELVRECMDESSLVSFIKDTIFKEIIPTLTLSTEELESFALAVIERFKNPYIDHRLMDISLNSTSKWNARVLPTLIDYWEKFGSLPENIMLSFAALLKFYCDSFTEKRYEVHDSPEIISLFEKNCYKQNREQLIDEFVGQTGFLDENLTKLPGFNEKIVQWIERIEEEGMKRIVDEVFGD